ncbi:MAG: hypothetical protein HN757_04950 [Calditrichaeota bacterium]|jgi:hypothetical protein|nr:hypothetical protein [Calditrichota bacterium]
MNASLSLVACDPYGQEARISCNLDIKNKLIKPLKALGCEIPDYHFWEYGKKLKHGLSTPD